VSTTVSSYSHYDYDHDYDQVLKKTPLSITKYDYVQHTTKYC